MKIEKKNQLFKSIDLGNKNKYNAGLVVYAVFFVVCISALLLVPAVRYAIIYNGIPLVVIVGIVCILKKKLSSRHLFLMVIACGIIVHWYHLSSFPVKLEPDSYGYINWAQKIDNKILYDVNAYRTPLYPMILSVLLHSPFGLLISVVAIQHICVFISCVLLLKISSLCKMDARTGVIAGVLLVVNSLVAQSAQMIMTEIIFMTMSLICVTFLIQMIQKKTLMSAVITGVVFGVTAHIREMLQPLLYLVCLFLCFKRKWNVFLIALIAVFITLVSCIPWSLFNYKHFNVYSLSAHLGINIFTKCVSYKIYNESSPEFTSIVIPYENVLNDLQISSDDWKNPEDSWQLNRVPHVLVDTLIKNHGYTFETAGKYLTGQSLQCFAQHPYIYSRAVIITLYKLLFKHYELYPSVNAIFPVDEGSVPKSVFAFLRGIVYVPGWFVSFFIICGLKRRELTYWLPFIVYTSGLLITAMVQTGLTRYTIPWIPFMLLSVSECSVKIFTYSFRCLRRILFQKTVA